jgi:predicted HTH transcriptional regulator
VTIESIKKQLFCGEDYHNQFKQNFSSIDNLAAEIAAFANCEGGKIYIGVNDDGQVTGLESTDIKRLNQAISNVTSQKIEPPIFVKTEIFSIQNKRVLIIDIPLGSNKPYVANKNDFWVKNGADKRRATREELFRLMQASSSLFADELSCSIKTTYFDFALFETAFQQYYGDYLTELDIDKGILLQNLKLATGDELTLAGALLFGKNIENLKPQYSIKATYYGPNDTFLDKEDITGRLFEQYKRGLDFITRNLHRVQKGEDFNTPGELEVPLGALKEILANALIHRDYFIQSSIFVNIFPDRIEITSPGKLPNSITIDSIKLGIHIERNPILLSFASKERDFGYTGRGSGIPKVLKLCKSHNVKAELYNDLERNQFKVTFYR